MKRIVVATAVLACLTLSTPARSFSAPRDPEQDKQALVRLETEWLNATGADTMARIYAPDFVHILADGRIVTGREELEYRSQHPALASGQRPPRHFEDLQVRIYGDVGIVNGRTVVTGSAGEVVRKTSFTDVFRWRRGRWQAINAQETTVVPSHRK
jgi:ketosteroid isomerase-like protein